MEHKNNDKKSAQLGMPVGTANGRLRKMILFDLVQRIGEDVCFHCRKRIDDIGNFSIEHKTPWLDAGPALFWDLENITFSHMDCNSRAGRKVSGVGRTDQRKVGPEGTAWCHAHAAFLPMDRFSCNASRWNGVEAICRACRGKMR